ncbi:MAG: AbrB/MazE/SpoVT family DNA-binding domain-containing protein [Chloroflexi bacterium]|nr:AbrB/MazE/SpoVT family DNA-binding domain-containing protein [Chloroflexota bacterium]
MDEAKTRLQHGDRPAVLSRYRKASGVKPHQEAVPAPEEGAMKVVTMRQAIRRAQALVRRYVPEGRKLSEELDKRAPLRAGLVGRLVAHP